MIEELKQRILAKAAKIYQYEQRIQQYRINRLFKVEHHRFNGQPGSSNGVRPNTEESRIFWGGIWSVEEKLNKEAKWLSDLKEEIVKVELTNAVINDDKVKKLFIKMPNWRTFKGSG